jgi:hypothetical protein
MSSYRLGLVSVACHFYEQVLQRKQAGTVISASRQRTEPHIACCVITQSPYSPNLAPTEFRLFPTLKMGLKRIRFATLEDIKSTSTAELRKIRLPLVLPMMAGSLEEVRACARILIWMWLDKRCRISYHYSAIPPFRELFDCPSLFRCEVVFEKASTTSRC